jgi:type II secretory pathway component PulF
MDMPMYQEAIEAILAGIKKWETIYSNLRFYTNIIPADVMVLVKVWEQTASLWQTLENVVVNYHEELEKRMNDLSKFIEPIVIVFMGTVILMIALSVFWVIWSILDAAQNSG